MRIPDIETYKDYREFFKDFVGLNKALGPKYSHRYFAKRLRWPISLIHDVISGRKNLSVSRCLEFSDFAEFNDVKTKHFIFLCLDASVSDSSRITIAKIFASQSPGPETDNNTLKVSGQINIKKENYQEALDKINELKEWLTSLDPVKNGKTSDSVLCQYEMILSPRPD